MTEVMMTQRNAMNYIFFSDFEVKLKKWDVHISNSESGIYMVRNSFNNCSFNQELIAGIGQVMRNDTTTSVHWFVNEKILHPDFIKFINTYAQFIPQYVEWRYEEETKI